MSHSRSNAPPRLLLRFFRWFCHPDFQEDIEGDLHELFERKVGHYGKRKAKWLFALDVLKLFRPGIIRNLEWNYHLNNYGMFKNYFLTALRNIRKYKVFSFINVFGLALAMSVCMLIILMLADQKSYDQFHSKKDRIYRILTDKPNARLSSAVTSFPLAPALRADYPVIEKSTHLHLGVGGDALFNGKTIELRGFFADTSFFKVFNFELERGDVRNALLSPNSMVITSEIADALFSLENPIGKTLEFTDRRLNILRGVGIESSATDWGSFTITGVINSTNLKSHLKFDVLVSYASIPILINEKKKNDLTDDWLDHNVGYTFVLLAPGKPSSNLSVALNDLVARKYAHVEKAKGLRLTPQKLTSVTPGIFVSSPSSFSLPIEAYYFLSFLAIAIMVSACLNYTNLATARALTRAKEIGIRKVTGANRKSLIYQFLSESILTALFALALAITLLIFIKPAFKGLWVNQHLNFDLHANASVYLIFMGFALIIGCIAGLYPALQLSKFQPIKALKNDPMRPGKLTLQKVLSTSQFVISLFFITTSILIYNQFKHHLELEYGLNPKNIVNVSLQSGDHEKVTNELASVPGVVSISASDKIPGSGQGTNGIGLKKAGTEENEKACDQFRVNENFIDNLEIKLIAGRNLPEESSDRFILVNETAVKELGFAYPLEIVGQVFQSSYEKEVEVIGVVEDFRFRMPSEQDKIGPLILRNQKNQFRFVQLKINSNDLAGTMAKLEEKWRTIDHVHPFKYQFYEEQLRSTNKGFADVVSILGFIAFLAITIACLGLLGMTTYLAERRKKEVGIRKVLGAEEFAIALLLSKGFLRMLALSVFIGAPLSYVINNFWLQNFPNRVEFGFGTVFIGTLLLLVLGLITIGSQTIRASRRNPVDALRAD